MAKKTLADELEMATTADKIFEREGAEQTEAEATPDVQKNTKPKRAKKNAIKLPIEKREKKSESMQILLKPSVKAKLAEVSKRSGCSMTEVVALAIEELYERYAD